jgi:phosphoribosylformylglycinamidine (FGAM) synthase-like enzyme
MDIGDGYGVVFKIESHNHPSAIEPFRCNTGVNWYQQRYFTNGCRPNRIIKFFALVNLNVPKHSITSRRLKTLGIMATVLACNHQWQYILKVLPAIHW